MTGYMDRPLDEALRNYQADRGVRVDGYLNPGGETGREIDTDLTLLGGLRKRVSEGADLIGDLGKRAATGLAEGSMRARQGLFDLAAGVGYSTGLGDLGFARASDHLGHYLSGKGGTKPLSSADVEREPALTNAEQTNRLLFETRTFRAATGDQRLNESASQTAGRRVRWRLDDSFETPAGLLDLARTSWHLLRSGSDGGPLGTLI